MRKLLILAVITAAMASITPSQAYVIKKGTKTFRASPCAALCAYWVPNTPADPTKIDPMTYNPETLLESTKNACTRPSPAGSWSDLVVTAPLGANLLAFSGTPVGDWDLFICAKPASGNNGRWLGTGANAAINLTKPLETCVTGCYEKVRIPVVAGRRYVLRAYNWLDTDAFKGTYVFYHV